jgi:hypothetical protein
MTTSTDLRTQAVTALKGATSAAANVFSPRDWPTWSGAYPVLFVTTPNESGESQGRNGPPQFTVTTTLRVTARVQTKLKPLDAGAAEALSALEAMREQIKVALINYPPLMDLLQQYPSFRSTMDVSDDGGLHLGELTLELEMEFYQGPEDFYPIPTVPLAGIDLTVEEPNGVTRPGLTINYTQ